MNTTDALTYVDEILAADPISPNEDAMRRKIISQLFARFRSEACPDPEIYLADTLAIPIDKLALAVLSIIRSRVYPSLPSIGEIWTTARKLAGMDGSQYDAGRYIRAPLDWPPPGLMHGPLRGQFAPMRKREDVAAVLARSRVLELPEVAF